MPRTTDSRHPYPISPNLIKDKPFPVKIDHVWVGDITYIPLQGGGWCYLAVWMDLFSRKVTGWQLRNHMKEGLIIEAFKKAWSTRKATEGLIVHSDRGGQYAGNIFRKLLKGHKLLQSMSGVDNPYDNAFMESYFSRFKAELLEGGAFDGLENARTAIFEYIETYYNPIRRHSALGYISPMAFERKASYSQKEEGPIKRKKEAKKRKTCWNMENSSSFPHSNTTNKQQQLLIIFKNLREVHCPAKPIHLSLPSDLRSLRDFVSLRGSVI